MLKTIAGIALLSLALTACESNNSEENANAPKPAATTQTAATPAPVTPLPEPSASVTQLKAGDKVKVTVDGKATEASIVSVDEKTGKVTVKIKGEAGERTFAISEVTKQ